LAVQELGMSQSYTVLTPVFLDRTENE
jgi:hypothetical protein